MRTSSSARLPGWLACSLMLAIVSAAPARAAISRELLLPVRGKTLTVETYRPARAPAGTILMNSGDAGWAGLAATLAHDLSERGYLVVGFNSREYLAAFRTQTSHLGVTDPPADFRTLMSQLKTQQLLVRPVFLSGMSEGAALAVLEASDSRNHDWLDGVVTLGIPPRAELAWRWVDYLSLIRKTDANEPSFAPYDFVGGIAPVPFVMLQSRRDEYITARDYARCDANARAPKKLVLIDASNHRFTDRRVELLREYLAALSWMRDPQNRIPDRTR